MFRIYYKEHWKNHFCIKILANILLRNKILIDFKYNFNKDIDKKIIFSKNIGKRYHSYAIQIQNLMKIIRINRNIFNHSR